MVLSFLCFSVPVHSQSPDPVYNKILKRYGNVTPWANGYIIKVNSRYGFANKSGRLVISISNPRFDTLLPDRANVSYASWGSALLDGNGNVVAHGDGLYYYLLNRKSRLFAMRLKDNQEKFCNDKGEILFGMVYDARIPKESLLGINAYVGNRYLCGLTNFFGDTILPLRYQTIGYGYNHRPSLYCGIRNDTAFVFSPNRNLLFSKTAVQFCFGIDKNFIGLGKYGMYALVNRSGRLLTGFHYTYIETIAFADSIVQQADKNHMRQAALAPHYFMTHRGSSRGLIDSSGKEILPAVYESIKLNSNGWLVLQKTSYEREELVNKHFERVLETEAGGISFIDKRYVRVETGRNTAQPSAKFYDMVLNNFVESPPIKKYNLHEDKNKNENTSSAYFQPHWGKDTVRINEAGSLLLKKNGLWGVCSFTGDTILPFVYDTAFQHGAIYVGRKGNLAPISWEGDLVYPIGLSELPQYWSVVDSQVIVKNNLLYSYKGWRLQKVEPGENRAKDPYLQFVSGIAYADGRSAAKPGLYNRGMKKIGNKPYRYTGYPMIRSTGIVAVGDSAKGLVAIIDSTGRQLVPWIKEPRYFMVRDHYALALNDTGKPDVLYRFENGSTFTDTVWLDAAVKFYLVKDRERYYGPDDSRPLNFEKRGYCKGILNTKPVMLIKGAEKVDMTYEAIRVRVAGKWGLYDYHQKQMLAHNYDSIDPSSYSFRLLVKNGKTGFFDIPNKRLITPIYDSVCYQNSYVLNYFIGYRNGLAEVVNTNGSIISGGWQNMKPLCHYSMENLVGTKNGIQYALYPTLGDSLETLPYKGFPADLEIFERYGDGQILVTKKGKLGLYSDIESSLQIPVVYESLERVNDYFFAKTSEPESLTVYNPQGLRMFSLSGTYYDPIPAHLNQWQLWGPKGYLVVNSKGKTIVPPGYNSIQALNTNGPLLYQVEAENGKYGLIDTSGKIFVQTIFDDIAEESMYKGYFGVTVKGKMGLLNPAGKLLTPYLYESLGAGKPTWLNDRESECSAAHTKKSEEAFFIVSIRVKETLKYGLLDKNGRLLIPCTYDNIQQVEGGKTVVVNKDGFSRLVDLSGKRLTTFKYDYIQNFKCGQAQFRRGELEGYLSPDGKETLNKKPND